MSRHRIRSISNPSLHRSNSDVSSSATVTKSLLNDPSSNVAASSEMAAAAAAAAFRSRPARSVSVTEVKTKRMLRRKSSASSYCNPGAASTELQTIRKSSSGSMLQQSFHESSSTWSQVPMNTPPVPPLPDKIPWKIPESRNGLMKSESFHNQKISRQASCLGNNKLTESATRPATSYYQKSSSSPSSGRFSINFSLPTDSRPNSPVTQRRYISPLPANLTSVISSSSSNPVNDANSRKLIPDPEPSIPKGVIDTNEESLAKRESLTQSQIRKASLVSDKFPGNSSKNAKATKNLVTGTKRTSTLSAKYSFMNKPSFFSSSAKTSPSKLELTDDQAHTTTIVTTNNNDNDLQYLKPLEFEKFPSNFSIDKDQFNYFDHEDSREDPTTIYEVVDNKCSIDPIHQAKESPLSPLLIHPAKLSSGQTLDSKVSIDDPNCKNNSQSVQNNVSEISVGGTSVRNNEEIKEKYSPSLPMSLFPVNPKCSAAINYLTHSTNHPCKSALKYNASSLTFSGSENTNKVSTDEAHLKRRINRVSFDKDPSFVDKKSSVAINSSSIIDFQKIRDWSNQDSEKAKDVSFSMRINKIMKPRPRLPSFGSVCSKKKHEEPEELRSVRPMEKVDYILSPLLPVSPLSPLSSPTDSHPSLEMSEKEENKKSKNLIISNQVIDENMDNAANVQNFENQLHNHIESTKDHSRALNDFSWTRKILQNVKSAENLTTLTFEQMSGESNLTSKSSSKLLTVNTSESYLTFLESPNSSLYSQSPNNLKTPTSSTTIINMKVERLHIPGAWDSSNEDLDKSSEFDIKPDVGANKFSHQIENPSSVDDITTIYTHQVKKDSPQALEISEEDSTSHKTPENSKIEDDSESASIYCDAVENIVTAENSDYKSYNAIYTNPAVYEDNNDGRLRATKTNSIDRLNFAIPKKSDARRSKRLTKLIVGRLSHRQISDTLPIQPLRNTKDYRSFSLSPKSLSEPVVKENYTRSVSKGELLDSKEVKLFIPGISMRREESRESVSSFKRARPIVRELHLRSSMREPIKPKANKFKLSALNSSRYETSSPPLTHTCNLRAASKFRFSKIRNRHPLSLPADEKIIEKNTNFLSNYNERQDLSHPTLNTRLTNFSNNDISKSRKLQESEVSQPSLKAPIVQNHLGDCLDIRSNNYHQSNEYSDPINTFESNETVCSVFPISTEQNSTIYSTSNIINQTSIKPKENLISIIRRMKSDVNDKVRKQEKEKITTPITTQDLQNQTIYTLKNQDSPLNYPNQASEQSPSWPLPTSEPINAQVTNTKSPKLYINQTTTVTSASTPIKHYFSDSDKSPISSLSTRPDSPHQKRHGSLRRMLRRDG